MDRLDRKLIQLKMEREAVRKETDDASKKRLDKLEQDIAGLEPVLAIAELAAAPIAGLLAPSKHVVAFPDALVVAVHANQPRRGEPLRSADDRRRAVGSARVEGGNRGPATRGRL